MVNLPSNYGLKTTCKLCKVASTEDNQMHLLKECETLKQSCSELQNNDVKYEDLFGEDEDKLCKVVKLFDIALRKRVELLEKAKTD